jgi:hypothetical protein
MDAAANTPSTRYAVLTFITLLGVPIAVFVIAGFALLRPGAQELGWAAIIIIYALATSPGLVLGTRYLDTRKTKIGFILGYPLACFSLMIVAWLMIGCALTNVCL